MASVSVLIPTLNEEGVVKNLLRDLEHQTLQPFEIIVIDAGSEDCTVEECTEFDCKMINSHPPVGHQRDQAGRLAKGDILVFLDADVRLSDTFLERVVNNFEKRRLDIACPLYWYYNATVPVRIYQTLLNIVFIIVQKIKPSGGGAMIIVRRSIFEKSDGFRAEYKFDDIEFISRVGSQNRFRIIPYMVNISDRRFRKFGFLSVVRLQMKVAWHHILNKHDRSNDIEYEFGKFKEHQV